ncbi:uncharacterized protein BDV17DRAFT_275418 [Aspergillus undulatus]|uniref:uncharacterized protein n=1 Tax=Aspergillus undulatus TaxID=1810928 RepID=UPI003CCD7E51
MALMQPSKPTIVFVAGGRRTTAAYDLLLPTLYAAGYSPLACMHLPSIGATSPVKYGDDVAVIRKVVSGLIELGQEVTGGMPFVQRFCGNRRCGWARQKASHIESRRWRDSASLHSGTKTAVQERRVGRGLCFKIWGMC